MHSHQCSSSIQDSQKCHQDSIGGTPDLVLTQQVLPSRPLQSRLINVKSTKHTLLLRRNGKQSLRYPSKRSKCSVQHKRSPLKTKKVSASTQEPTEESKQDSTDVVIESEQIQALQPVTPVFVQTY